KAERQGGASSAGAGHAPSCLWLTSWAHASTTRTCHIGTETVTIAAKRSVRADNGPHRGIMPQPSSTTSKRDRRAITISRSWPRPAQIGSSTHVALTKDREHATGERGRGPAN